jgi:hypothetical protein
MSRFYTSAAIWITLTLLPLCLSTDPLFAAGTTDEPDKTTPQGSDPPGADDAGQPNQPMVPRKGVISRLQPATKKFTLKRQTQMLDTRKK